MQEVKATDSSRLPASQPSSPQPPVTPDRIMGMLWAFAPPLVVDAAIRNGIFDALDRSPKTEQELAAELGASERGISSVAGALTGFGLLHKQANGCFQLAPDTAAFLVRNKPGYQGGIFERLTTDVLPDWLDLASVTKSGIPASKVDKPQQGAAFFGGLVDSLFPMNYPAAQALANHLKPRILEHDQSQAQIDVLDLATGSGVWGVAMAQASPRVHVTAVDLEPVLAATRRTAERFGLTARFQFLSGDIRDSSWGDGYSIALLGHILHSEGAKASRALLKQTFAALRPGGTIAIAEFLVNDARTGPPHGLIFAVNMLVQTTEGTTFSFEEIRSWLESAGFENIRTLDVPAPSPLILAQKPE